MILPNDDIKIIASHTSPVLHVFHFDINEPYHFMSLSDNGEIIEWVFEKTFKNIKEIEKCNLQRPSDEILIINKHEIRKLKKGEYIKITSAIQFNNFIAVGYDDGLILIYQIEKQALNKSKQPVGSLHEKIEEENQSDEENQKEKEKEKEEDKRLTDETKMDELISKIDYYNTFSLYYILLGHSQQIRSLFYVANKKFLVTSSDNCTVKIYDMTNGFSLYHFNLDCMINKIILMEKKKEQNLILFSDDPYKLIIDITKEPFSFNHYSFKYNNVSHIEKMNNGYYLLSQRSVYQFDNNLEYKGTFTNLIPIDYTLIKMYKDNIILFDAENYVELVSFKGLEEKKPIVDQKNKKAAAKPAKGKNDKKEEDIKQSDQYNIKTEFKVKMGTDEISECFIYDQFGFCSCQDTNIYLIDFELKKSMHYERSNMANEDAASLQLMNSLANVKSKKKKGKNKGKKKKKK